MRLVQFLNEGGERRVGMTGDDPAHLQLLTGFECVYDLVRLALRAGESLESVASSRISAESANHDRIAAAGRLLPPVDHPDPARCIVSLTGLTHVGSAKSRDEMHGTAAAQNSRSDSGTDSSRMFRIGLEGGKPPAGEIGAQPEWGYKGDGRSVVPPGHELTQPGYAEDGGEEAEIAGLYVIDDRGDPWRIGFAVGNEFADHVTEKRNYLYLAHSKLRQCSFGPELLLGDLPESVTGTVRILRNDETVWSSPFESGEAHMCHSIANLEHHHFKYEQFRRPGDLHVHFLGANGVSFGAGVVTRSGDVFEINIPLFGRPLRNKLKIETKQACVRVRRL